MKRALSVLALGLVVAMSGSAFATSKKPKKAVPEFDGKASGSAAALLLGGVLVLAERKRRKSNND